MTELAPVPSRELARAGFERLPAAIGRAGEAAAWRFVEFFAATIRNRNTRAAYGNAITQFFAWCESHRIHRLEEIKPVVVAGYIERHEGAPPTVIQHLAAIRTYIPVVSVFAGTPTPWANHESQAIDSKHGRNFWRRERDSNPR